MPETHGVCIERNFQNCHEGRPAGPCGAGMADERRWRDPDFPFPMNFPTRILPHIVLDLSIINILVFYWLEHVPLIHVVSVIIIEVVALTVAMTFWVPVYGLKW
jgi:hypothetical protein